MSAEVDVCRRVQEENAKLTGGCNARKYRQIGRYHLAEGCKLAAVTTESRGGGAVRRRCERHCDADEPARVGCTSPRINHVCTHTHSVRRALLIF